MKSPMDVASTTVYIKMICDVLSLHVLHSNGALSFMQLIIGNNDTHRTHVVFLQQEKISFYVNFGAEKAHFSQISIDFAKFTQIVIF